MVKPHVTFKAEKLIEVFNMFFLTVTLRFCLEITTLILIIIIGNREYPMPVNLLIGIILPIFFTLIWSRYMAPKSPKLAPLPIRIIIETIIFGTCSYLLFAKISIKWSLIYMSITLLNSAIIHTHESY